MFDFDDGPQLRPVILDRFTGEVNRRGLSFRAAENTIGAPVCGRCREATQFDRQSARASAARA
jgi:hypothetical protein